MLARVATVALMVTAMASNALAYEDDDSLFNGWATKDTFSSVIADRLASATPVASVPVAVAPVPVAVAAPSAPAVQIVNGPAGTSTVYSIDGYNTGVTVNVPRTAEQHAVVVASRSAYAATAAQEAAIRVHAANSAAEAVVAAQRNVDVIAVQHQSVQQALERAAAANAIARAAAVVVNSTSVPANTTAAPAPAPVSNSTSSALEAELTTLRAQSKDLAKKLLDAQTDIQTTIKSAETAKAQAYEALAKADAAERESRLAKRAANRAARLARRKAAHDERVKKHNEEVTKIENVAQKAKTDIIEKYKAPNTSNAQSLRELRSKIHGLKVSIAQKKLQEQEEARVKLQAQLKAAQDQVNKFAADLAKLAPVHVEVARPTMVLPVAPGVGVQVQTSPYRNVRVSSLPARAASIATIVNPAAAVKIAETSREITSNKATKVREISHALHKASRKAARANFKRDILAAKSVEAQHDFVEATVQEQSVQSAIRNTNAEVTAHRINAVQQAVNFQNAVATNAAQQAAVNIGEWVPVTYSG